VHCGLKQMTYVADRKLTVFPKLRVVDNHVRGYVISATILSQLYRVLCIRT